MPLSDHPQDVDIVARTKSGGGEVLIGRGTLDAAGMVAAQFYGVVASAGLGGLAATPDEGKHLLIDTSEVPAAHV